MSTLPTTPHHRTKSEGVFGSDAITNTGTWQVYLDQSLDSLGSAHFTHTTVSDHQVKYGNVSSQGLGGSSDRSLGDYMQVQVGLRGEALISYVDDTSENRNPDFSFGSGQTPAEAAGPTMFRCTDGRTQPVRERRHDHG